MKRKTDLYDVTDDTVYQNGLIVQNTNRNKLCTDYFRYPKLKYQLWNIHTSDYLLCK